MIPLVSTPKQASFSLLTCNLEAPATPNVSSPKSESLSSQIPKLLYLGCHLPNLPFTPEQITVLKGMGGCRGGQRTPPPQTRHQLRHSVLPELTTWGPHSFLHMPVVMGSQRPSEADQTSDHLAWQWEISDWPAGGRVCCIFLNGDQCGRDQSTVSGTTLDRWSWVL